MPIGERHARAAGALHAQSEVLEDLQAARAGGDVGLEPRRRPPAVAWLIEIPEIEVGEHHHAVGRVARRDCAEHSLEALAGPATEVHEHAQIERVHVAHHLCVGLGRDLPVVAVDVDDRVLRPRNGVHRYDERGFRLVFADRQILGDAGRRQRGERDDEREGERHAPGGARRGAARV